MEKTASKNISKHKRELVEVLGFQNYSKQYPHGEHGVIITWLACVARAAAVSYCHPMVLIQDSNPAFRLQLFTDEIF